MEKTAIFPGSFDPFTIGHESIIKRALPLFDKIIIAIGVNSNKNSFLSTEQRILAIKTVFQDYSKIEVQSYTGLTVDFCTKVNANYIIRGLRTAADFEYERAIAQMNNELSLNIETIFLLTLPEHTFINSSVVREIIINNGDATKFLPKKFPNINDIIKNKLKPILPI